MNDGEHRISPAMKSHFMNLYSMMLADSEVSPSEKKELYRIAKDEFKLTAEEIDKLLYADEILFYAPDNAEEKLLYLYDMALMAWADGEVTDDEKGLLKRTMTKFSIEQDDQDDILTFLLDNAQKRLSHDELLEIADK